MAYGSSLIRKLFWRTICAILNFGTQAQKIIEKTRKETDRRTNSVYDNLIESHKTDRRDGDNERTADCKSGA